MRSGIARQSLLRSSAYALVLMSAGSAFAQSATYTFDIPAEPLATALQDVARVSGKQIIFSDSLTAGRTTTGLHGTFNVDEAMQHLLAGTDLSATETSSDGIVVRPKNVDAASERGAASQSDSIETIFVTAEKRAENIQDIPLSISVLNGLDLERRGFTGMADYLTSLPSVSHLDEGIGRNATIIRGISLGPQYQGIDGPVGQPVSYYFGETPLSDLRWNAPDIKLVDMDRVEVLRGPQGTLYGAGTLSGAVRSIPAAPQLDVLSGNVEVGYSDTAHYGSSNFEEQAVINVPVITGELAIRAVAYAFEDSGYFKNIAGSDPAFVANASTYGVGALAVDRSNVGSDKYAGVRFSVLWQPSEDLHVTLSYLDQDATQNGLPEEDMSAGSYLQERLQFGAGVGGGERLRDSTQLGNLVVSYQLPGAQLVSSSSYSYQIFGRNYGLDKVILGGPYPQTYNTSTRGFSEEARLVSDQLGPFRFIVGVFYENLSSPNHTVDLYGGTVPALNVFGVTPWLDLRARETLHQEAVFGEASYDVLSSVTLTFGVRRSQYNDEGIANEVYLGTPDASDVKAGEAKTLLKANASYRPTDDSMLYALWSQGYREDVQPASPVVGPGCDDGHGFVIGSDYPITGEPVKSDYLNNYEIGGKYTGERVVLDATLFQIDWTNLPVRIYAPPPCNAGYTLNAGQARSRGVELQAAINLTDRLQLDFSGSYVHAVLVGDNPGVGTDGQRLPGSPSHQFSAGLQYAFDLVGLPAYVRSDYTGIGGFYNNIDQTGPKAGDYGLLSARLGVTFDRYEAELYGKNLTNVAGISWVDSAFAGQVDVVRPLTIGLNLKYHY